MRNATANRFRSKLHGMNARRGVYTCLTCNADHDCKTVQCACGKRDLHYFPSMAEMRRYKALRFQESLGAISDLQLQPTFPIKINGIAICKYRADFSYTRDGLRVIEDVKGIETDVFKLKRKLVEAEYGIKLTIVRG